MQFWGRAPRTKTETGEQLWAWSGTAWTALRTPAASPGHVELLRATAWGADRPPVCPPALVLVPHSICKCWDMTAASPGGFLLGYLNKSASLYFWFRTRYSRVISVLGLTMIPLRLHLHLSQTPLRAPGTSLLAPLQAFCSSSSQDAESLASAPHRFLTAAFPSQSIVFWYRSADFGANPGTREQEPCSSAR